MEEKMNEQRRYTPTELPSSANEPQENSANEPQENSANEPQENSANEPQEKIAVKKAKKECSRALPIIGAVFAVIVFSFALVVILMQRWPREEKPASDGGGYFELQLDEVAPEMISGFNGLRLSVTNGEHIVEIENFVAKRVSAVNGYVRVNFNATAYEQSSGGRWETSVLIEFLLVGDGPRLKCDDIVVRRCHIYDLPKTLGSDELEYNPAVISFLKGGLRKSKEVISDSQKVVDVKLTTDDNVRISWESAK